MPYSFQTRNNKIKLLTEYESLTQKVLLPVESILQNVKQLEHAHLSWHVRFEYYRLQKLHNNLEILCIYTKVSKVKISLLQAIEAHRVARG
jgi:hypothetical protein